jgi:LysR family glycine cleavage system transcriptional activator
MPPLPQLPPLHALRAFHAAARFGRIKDAAEALGLTESAVSHQIKKLEAYLSVRLFERNGPQIRLSDDGQRYFAALDPAFTAIRDATAALRAPAGRNRVSLTLPASLATYWLIPRLDSLEKTCPGIDLELVTTARLIDLRREGVDLAIRYGGGQWPGLTVRPLLGEQIVPVCRPGYVRPDEALDPQSVFTDKRLIVETDLPQRWAEWAAANGLTPPDLAGALRFSTTDQVLRAAERGLGIAIGERAMVDDLLAAGTLVAPFSDAENPILCNASYWLGWPKDGEPTVAARKVMRWLQALAAHPDADGEMPGAADRPKKPTASKPKPQRRR